MYVEERVCACVHIYACIYMYDVLVEIGGGGRREGSDWLKPATNMRRESRL